MTSVWKPQRPPPRLSRFCHLSADGQTLMAAVYSSMRRKKKNFYESKVRKVYNYMYDIVFLEFQRF